MTALIIDTETTGFKDPEPVEVAWLKLVTPQFLDDFGRFLGWLEPYAFRERYRPSKPIELGALATHHIMDEDLVDCPPSSSFALPDGVEYLIGHNVDFDWRVIGQPDVKRICTCALSRHLWPEASSHTLGAMLYHLFRAQARDRLKNAHSAADDVENCLLLLRKELELLGSPQSWEEVWQFSELARAPKVMSFGKWKHTPIAELPGDYVAWLLRQDDVDPYLARALRNA